MNEISAWLISHLFADINLLEEVSNKADVIIPHLINNPRE